MIDYDEIRKEVAIRHGVLLGENDPILVTVTLNELVLRRYVEIISSQSESHQKALAATLAAQTDQAKETAGRVITDAASYVSEQVRLAVASAVAEAGDQLRRDIAAAQNASRDAAAGVKDAQAARTTAVISAVVSVAFALVALSALLFSIAK